MTTMKRRRHTPGQMVTPDRRRIAVERLQAGFGVSESGVPCGGPAPFAVNRLRGHPSELSRSHKDAAHLSAR